MFSNIYRPHSVNVVKRLLTTVFKDGLYMLQEHFSNVVY